jgi:hypothetical protein
MQCRRRLRQQPDSVAERGGFEPSRPFISHMLPRFHAHFLSPDLEWVSHTLTVET